MIRHTLTEREFCDLELLLDGSFAPLTGFMEEKDYYSVVEKCRLADGSVWPMPIVLTTSKAGIKLGDTILLHEQDGGAVASLLVSSTYKPNITEECIQVYGTTDRNHPGVTYLLDHNNDICIGGEVKALNGGPKATHHDFIQHRKTPAELKAMFKSLGWTRIVGFQTRNPMHRCHMQLVINALEEVQKAHPTEKVGALIHPAVGPTQASDIDYATRMRCYQEIVPDAFPSLDSISLAILQLAMRMAGPREALWHALIRRNCGCTHFIMGRDPAGPSTRGSDGSKFYGAYNAHKLVNQFEDELGITIVKSQMLAYVPRVDRYLPLDQIRNEESEQLSGTELRRRLRSGESIPLWFTVPAVANILRTETRAFGQGCCFYFVGLSGSGKSTLARALADRLREIVPARQITVLDGDEIRRNISAGLGFSREDRSKNVRRIGYVASLLVKTGGIVLCANIAPYTVDREWNRKELEQYGTYNEIYVATPIATCEHRDAKGLYKRARSGEIQCFTGITDPFEAPTRPELTLDTSQLSIEECLEQLMKLWK